MQWNTSLSPFPSEKKCQKATIRAGSNWQSQQGGKEIDRRGDAIPCLLWYWLQNFLQQWLQLSGHWISFASHPHQNPPHSNTVNQTLHWDVLPLSLTSFCCQWSVAAVWKVTPRIYILDWLYPTSNARPHARLVAILASSLPWLHFNIFILFTIYRRIRLNWARSYRVKHHQFCSWSLTSPQLTPKSLSITVKQTQNQTQSPARLAW